MEYFWWFLKHKLKTYGMHCVYRFTNQGRARGLGCLCRDVFVQCPFFILVPRLFHASHPANERSAKWIILPTQCAKNQRVMCEKRLGRDTTGYFLLIGQKLHSFFVLKCGRVVTGSKIDNFGKDDEKCVRKCNQYVTRMWPICDSSETHMWLMFDPSVTQPVTHTWFIFALSVICPVKYFDSYVANVRFIHDQFVTHNLLIYDPCVIHPTHPNFLQKIFDCV